MQLYCIRMFNFLRFGGKDNSLVFDLSIQDKKDLCNNVTTMDAIYDRVMENPMLHIKEVKERGIENLLGITGIVGGDDDRSNGVGKSSIFEGVCYAFFEKICRRNVNTDKIEKAGLSVVTRIDGKILDTVKTSYVEILFEENNKIYRLKRGRDFTKSQKSSTPFIEFDCVNNSEIDSQSSHRTADTKLAISDVITKDYDTFISSQLFAQNDSGKFLTGTDKIKKEMLIGILKLENVVAGCLEAIREKKNNQEKIVNSVKSNIELYENKLKAQYIDHPIDSIYFEVNSDFVKRIIEKYDNNISSNNDIINTYEIKLLEITKNILELQSSDKLTKLGKIKEDGIAARKEKEIKESEMLSKIEEWNKLKKDATSKKDYAAQNLKSLSLKINEKKAEKENTEKTISLQKSEIDSYGDIKEKSEIDNKRKEELEEKINKYLPVRDNINCEISSETTIISMLETNIKKLSSKLSVCKDGKFHCPECNSLVTSDHINSKIKEYSESKDVSVKKKNGLLEKKEKLDKGLSKLSEELRTIPDWSKSEIKLSSLKTNLLVKQSLLTNINTSITEYLGMIEKDKKEITNLEDKIKEYDNKITDIKNSFEEVIKILTNKLIDLKRKYSEADADAKVISSKIEEYNTNKNSISIKIKNLSEDVGRYRNNKENFEKSVKELSNLKFKLGEELKIMNRYLILEDIYGLEGIQTRIVKRYLPLLNLYIKEYLDILSNGELSVKMMVNDKSKVDMIITGGTADSFDMLSGGEKTIIRLATDIGLSLLTFSKTAQKPDIILLDEVLGSLDNSRTENVFRMLKKLQDKFSRILLITHKSDIKDRINTNIIIEKDIGKNTLSRIVRIT